MWFLVAPYCKFENYQKYQIFNHLETFCLRVSYNAMAALGGNKSSVTREAQGEFRHDFPKTIK